MTSKSAQAVFSSLTSWSRRFPLPAYSPIIEGTSDEALLSRLVTTSMGQIMGDFFESDEILAAMWNPADLGSLWETGSGFGFALSRAVSRREIRGVTKPGGTIVGGIGQVTRLLAEAAEEEGVEILTASPVSKILVESGAAAGVELVDARQNCRKNGGVERRPKTHFPEPAR